MEDERKFENLQPTYRSTMGSKLGDRFAFGSGTSKRKRTERDRVIVPESMKGRLTKLIHRARLSGNPVQRRMMDNLRKGTIGHRWKHMCQVRLEIVPSAQIKELELQRVRNSWSFSRNTSTFPIEHRIHGIKLQHVWRLIFLKVS